MKLDPNENAGRIIQRHEDGIEEVKQQLADTKKLLRICIYVAISSIATNVISAAAFIHSTVLG